MDLQAILTAIVGFINDALIPFVMAIAFFFFIWNAVRYFIIGGTNPDAQEKAKSLAVWGILAFVVITSLWGIVNIFTDSLGLDNTTPAPDYMERGGGDGEA
jgi:predicted PurR-regulated permease PerM